MFVPGEEVALPRRASHNQAFDLGMVKAPQEMQILPSECLIKTENQLRLRSGAPQSCHRPADGERTETIRATRQCWYCLFRLEINLSVSKVRRLHGCDQPHLQEGLQWRVENS